jgi:heptosyltransferase-2
MKVLVFRLSSLGDIILCASILDALGDGIEVEWVVKESFAPLLKSHPRISRLHVYNPKKQSWKNFLKEIELHRFDQIWDLHQSPRTFLARWVFGSRPGRWKSFSKQRLRRLGFFVFKKFWPLSLRPDHLRTLAQRTAGQKTQPIPANLRHLQSTHNVPSKSLSAILSERPTIGVMPSSAWEGKAWPTQHFVELIQQLTEEGHRIVILGQDSDLRSVSLVKACQQQGLNCIDGVGLLNIAETAVLFQHLQWLVSNDTGLAHLAESVGLRTLVLFGPTHPDLGFGPGLPQSRIATCSLWCQPCSKDGRWCIRNEPFVCMTSLEPSRVLEIMKKS